jgi:TatD DNase family protein
MIDTHCHLNYTPLEDDIDGVLCRAFEAGVKTVVVPGTTRESSESSVALAEHHEEVWSAVGIHPSDAHSTPEDDINRIKALALNPRVVAIGEVGLDYKEGFEVDESEIEARKARQKGLLWQMIEIARDNNKPLIIHSRDCFDDLYESLKTDAAGMKVVIHCFTGTIEEAQKWLDVGFHISLTGILTYKSAGDLREVAKMIPWERLMIETDAPWLAPQAFRGKTCEPAMVRETALVLAELRGVTLEEVDERTTSTADAFFNFGGLS